jgi:hypothetical protein
VGSSGQQWWSEVGKAVRAGVYVARTTYRVLSVTRTDEGT